MKSWLERSADRYLPFIGHRSENAVLLADGSLLAMLRLGGAAHELSDLAERRAAAESTLNNLYLAIGQVNVTLGSHFIRRPDRPDFSPSIFTNEFSEALEDAYYSKVIAGNVFVNEWYLSILVSPSIAFAGTQFGRDLGSYFSRVRSEPEPLSDDKLVRQLDSILQTTRRSLKNYRVEELGVRSNGPVWFSEIGEALHLLITTVRHPVPLAPSNPVEERPLGAAIYSDRVIFGHYLSGLLKYVNGGRAGCPRWAFEVQTAAGSKFGAMIGLRQYMPQTDVGILDALLNVPFPIVVTQSFGFLSKTIAVAKLGLKQNQMISAGDVAVSQIAALPIAKQRLMDGEFDMGQHHWSAAVYADNLDELDAHVGTVRAHIANAAAVAVPETLGIEAAYFAQLPGNGAVWRPRPAIVSSINFAHLADFAAYPTGEPTGHWGPCAVHFRTTAGTIYSYCPHVEDVGMTAFFGRTGSGKSTLVNFLVAGMFDKYLSGNDGIVFSYDKDGGGQLVAEAVGGKHVAIRAGVASGLAPLRGFDNTPYAQECLTRWLRGLIEYDGLGPLKPSDIAMIERGVAAQLRLPVSTRSLLGVRLFLGWRDPMGAGARLERWCRGGAAGWAFDGDEDLISYEGSCRYFDHDLTEILDTPEIIEPAAQYLRDRQRPFIDGRRVIMKFDEAQAYILSRTFRDSVIDDLATLRKNNGIVFLATQQPENLLLDPQFGAVLLGQTHTMFFAPTPNVNLDVYLNEPPRYTGPLKLTRGEVNAISRTMTAGSHSFLIKRWGESAESAIIDFNLSAIPEFVAVLSGTKNRLRLAQRLKAETPDWLEAYLKGRIYEEARD